MRYTTNSVSGGACVRLLTVDEVAARLSVSRGTVYNVINRNVINRHQLRSVKIGRARRIREDDLREYIEGLGS